MIMEFVNGSTAHRLLKRWVFPPRAALELVAEVARVLDKARRLPGPDGTPLGLIHRDLKPGNLMITEEGHVKLLDFGIAWAEFGHREAQTAATLGGTPGYIAPERLRGIDGPEGDIFSLGVLLHVLVTGQPATRVDVEELSVPPGSELSEILDYARCMRAGQISDRPTAAEVEARCRTWAQRTDGPDLRAFAMLRVPIVRMREDDGLVGSVLTETLSMPAGAPLVAPPSRVPRWLMAVVGVATAVVLFLVPVALGLAMYAAFGPSAPGQQGVRVQAEPVAARMEPPRAEVGDVEAAGDLLAGPVMDEAPEPVPAKPARRHVRRPDPRPAPAPTTHVAPVAPPPPAPTLVSVSFESEPRGAEVVLDGLSIGHTPLRNHPISVGPHRLIFRRDGQHATQEVRIGGRHGFRLFRWTSSGVVAE